MIIDFCRPPRRDSSAWRLIASRFSFLLWLFLVSGCGPSTGTVSGTVTFKNAMVLSGTVSVFAGGKVFEAEIQDGTYKISRIPPGNVKIAVIRMDPKLPDPYDALNKARAQMIERKAANPRQIDPAVVTDPMQLELLQRKRHLLPFVYSSPNTSDLRFTVSAGANTFDLNLQDRPKSK
jgi:hypothetical protein